MSKEKDRIAIFAKVLENCGNYFCNTCKELISGIQDFNDQTFLEFINDFKFHDSKLQNSLYACGDIGAGRPLESFQFLLDSFPEIDINSKSEPSSRIPGGGSNFLYLLGGIKWEDKYVRACVKYTINYIIAKVCRYITMRSTKTMRKKDAAELINKIYEFINPKSDPLLDAVNMLIIDEFKMAVSFTSINARTDTFSIVKPIFSDLKPKEDRSAVILTLFSETVFRFDDESQAKELLDLVIPFYNGKDNTSEPAAACTLNILGQLFVLFQKSCSSDDIIEYYKKSTENNDQTSFELRSLILAFSDNKSIHMSIKDFAHKCFSDISRKDNDLSTHIVRALTRFMYGKNYIPKPIQLLENEQYSWHVSANDYQDFLDMLEIVKKNNHFVSKASNEAFSDFLLQIACNDVNNFADDVFKKISKEEKIFNSIEESILYTFSRILEINTNFITKAKIEKSELEKVTLKIKEEGYNMCKKILKTKKGNEIDSSMSIYITPSFTQILNTICSPMKHSISDVHTVLSLPLMVSSSDQEFPKPRLLSVYMNKWKKANPVFDEKPKTVLDEDEDHKRTRIALKAHVSSSEITDLIKSYESNRVTIAALNLAPLILTPSNNNKMLRWMCAKIINKEPAIGVMAVRSIQASLHLNNENASKVINQLYLFAKENPGALNPDSIFCIVSALKNILETAAFERIPFDKSDYEHVFFIISLGLISSCFITRTITLDAIKMIQNPSVCQYYNQLDNVVSERGKELVFSILCPGTEDVDDIDTIKFSNFAKSKSSYLYTFYVAAFADAMDKGNLNESGDAGISNSSSDAMLPSDALVDINDAIDVSKKVNEDLRDFLIQLLSHSKNFEQDDPYFVIYVSTYILSTWKDDDKQKHGITHYIKKLGELGIDGIEEWISAATSSISPSLFSTKLVELIPSRPFALYLLRCTKNPNFVEKNILENPEAFKLGYSRFINDFFKTKCISKEATFSIHMSSSIHNTDQTALYAFGKALTTVFSTYSKKQQRYLLNCNGIFPRSPVTLPIVDDVLTTNESYAFWFNLSSENNLYFSVPCQTAYAELVKIMYIPDIWFELVTANIDKIVQHTPEIAVTLFTNYSGVLMPIYIRNSQTSYPFFAGMAKQFCTSDNFISEWGSKIANYQWRCVGEGDDEICQLCEIKPITIDEDSLNPDSPERSIATKSLNAAKRLSDLVLRNIGTLLAIATNYLIGKDVFQRMTAFDFIYVTALSAHLIYANNVQGTLNLSDELMSVKETFMTNFEQFFANTASKVICSLANHLPFLSEQFCSGIFAIESIKGGSRKKNEDNNDTNDSAEMSHHLSLKKSKVLTKQNTGSLSVSLKNRGKSIIPLPPSPGQSKPMNLPLNQSGARQVSLTGIAAFTQTNNNYLTSSTYINVSASKKGSSQKQLPLYTSGSMGQSVGSLAMIPMNPLNPDDEDELVMSAFDKDSMEICRYVASFIVPWMKRIRYIPERLHVFEGCLPSYQMFSMYTFIQSIVKLKCLLPITPPITNILFPTYKAAGSLFLIILTDLYFKMEDLRENCVAMITYAYTINSNHVMQYFLSFLNVRYWYYQQIQISKLNQAFDFRLFLQDMNVSGESSERDQEMIVDYNGMINFVLKMFIIFLHENPAQILPYKNMIIIYCALFFREFIDPSQELFHLLLNLKPPGACKIERSMNYVGPYTYEPLMEIFRQSILSNVISLIKPSLYSSSPSSLSTAVASGIFNLAASFDLNEEEINAFHKTYSFEDETNINDPQLDATIQTNIRNLLAVKNKTAVVNSFSTKDVSHYLMEWGLICGDSFVSSMALKMFVTLDFKATESEINYALDSIYLIYLMVKDAATARSKNGRQTLLKLADSDAKPDCATAYTHIQYLCMLCKNVISNPSNDLVNKILLTSFALLLLPEPGKIIKDQTRAKPEPIIAAALRNIYNYREFLPGFKPDKLIESKFDSSRTINKNDGKSESNLHTASTSPSISTDSFTFKGFTFYLFNSALNEESLDLSQKIIIYLLQKKLSFLLNGDDNNPAFTYYAIAPFLFASKSTSQTENEISDDDIKKAFVDIAKQSKESLENFHKVLVKNKIKEIKKKDSLSASFEALFNFYRTIVRIGNVQQVKAVLILASLIIKDNLISSSAQVIGELSRDIIQKRDYELKEDVNQFYKSLVIEFGGQISTQKKPAASTKEFPELFGGIKEEDVLEWRPSNLVSISTPIDVDEHNNGADENVNSDTETMVNTNSARQSTKEIDLDNDESDSYDEDEGGNTDENNIIDDNIDVFKKPKYYPPLFLTDYSLFVSDFMNNLLPVVEQVKVQPFTRWDDEIFSEEQAAQKNSDKDNPYENSIAVCYDDELEGDEKLALTKNEKKIKKVTKELQKLVSGRKQGKSKENRLASTINPVHSAVQYCYVEPHLFCPNLSMVDKVSVPNDTKQPDLPTIFFPV